VCNQSGDGSATGCVKSDKRMQGEYWLTKAMTENANSRLVVQRTVRLPAIQQSRIRGRRGTWRRPAANGTRPVRAPAALPGAAQQSRTLDAHAKTPKTSLKRWHPWPPTTQPLPRSSSAELPLPRPAEQRALPRAAVVCAPARPRAIQACDLGGRRRCPWA